MRSTILSASFVALLTALVWIFVASTRGTQRPGDLPPRMEGCILSLQRLTANERVVIAVQTWRFQVGMIERLYQVDGGLPPRFAARELRPAESREKQRIPALAGNLRDEEAVGLDSYLLFLRRGFHGGGHTRQEIVVGYYRDGSKIGEERFQDSTGAFSGVRYENGQVLRPYDRSMEDFPVAVFREVIPPWVIEERLEKPNQTPEPTPTAGTSAAEQPLVPAAVVAHL